MDCKVPQHYLADKIVIEYRSSSSHPVLVETPEGTKCVVKWRGAGEGPLASAIDCVTLQLARAVGVRTPKPCLVTVTPELARHTTHGELKDTIMRSLGINLGTEYIENATPFRKELADEIDPVMKSLIYLFDLLFLNIDRTDRNPNMLVAANELYCIDFSATMEIKMLMSGANYSEEKLLTPLRRHPFYSDTPNTLASPLASLRLGGSKHLRQVVDSISRDWLASEVREKVFVGITQLFDESRSILERRISFLANVPLETDEEYRRRTFNNRLAFEEATGRKL